MELGPFIAEPRLPGAQLLEVLHRPGHQGGDAGTHTKRLGKLSK